MSLTTLIKHMVGNQQNVQSRDLYAENQRNKEDPEPENLLNDGTSHGLVPIAMPSSPDALIRSRAWPWHLG
jgi:hypothetical protein